MKSKILFLGAIGLAASVVAACHHDDNGSPTPTPPANTSMALDTAQVLALAQQTSETSSPFAVNNGALTLTDTSETSLPIGVNTP